MMKTLALFVCLLLLRFQCQLCTDERKVSVQDNGDKSVINVGVIVDLKSWVGKVVFSCSKMAVFDFYNLNLGYRTRIDLHVRDSGGGSSHGIAAVHELLESVKVQAFIIPDVPDKKLFLTGLGNKVHVPLLSFSSISSSDEYPYFIHVVRDENNQFNGIAALLQAFRWRSFVFLYEDTADARLAQTYINEILQDNQLDVGYQIAISLHATDDQILDELHKLMEMKASIFLVHLSTSLSSQVLRNAKKLGLVSKGFVWIMTSKAMNLLDVQDSSVYESMQGILGFKSHPYASDKIQNLTERWKRSSDQQNDTDVEIRRLNDFGLWAYNAAWVLAEAVERTGIQLSQNWTPNAGSTMLRQITSSKFRPSVGKSQLGNRKLVPDIYDILNVIHKGEMRIGFWSYAYGFTKEINPSINPSSSMLETVIWPGFTSTVPESLLVRKSSRVLRIGVPANGRFLELINYISENNTMTRFSGYCIDVFEAAIKRLPYSIPFEFIEFNGSHNDLIYQVYRQNLDAAVGDITILSNRSAYVDFTIPYTEPGTGIVVRLDDNDPWFFFKPLQAELWIISACFFLLTGFIVWLIEHRINEEFQGPLARQFGTALWFAFSTIVYAHRERLQSNISRFVVNVWLFVVLILTSCYVAKLTSLLTVEQIKASHGFAGYSTTYIQGIAKSNLNFKDERLKPYQSPQEYDQALRHGGVRAILDELPYLKILVALSGSRYVIIESSTKTQGFGFAFPKGSPLVHDMSRAITELREEGILDHVERQWFWKWNAPVRKAGDSGSVEVNPLSADNFLALFFISAASELVAILVLLVFALREKLLLYRNAFMLFVTGELMVILRYLHSKMANVIDRVETR